MYGLLSSCSVDVVVRTPRYIHSKLSFPVVLLPPAPDPSVLQLLLKTDFGGDNLIKECASVLRASQTGGPVDSKTASARLIKSLDRIAAIPQALPRYFFQSKPTSTLHLSTQPASPHHGGSPITAAHGAGLILKISGLMTHSSQGQREVSREPVKPGSCVQSIRALHSSACPRG